MMQVTLIVEIIIISPYIVHTNDATVREIKFYTIHGATLIKLVNLFFVIQWTWTTVVSILFY